MTKIVDLGVLYSRSGTYAALADACYQGVMSAIETVHRDPGSTMQFNVVERDPMGDVDAYAPLCSEILRSSSASHVIGCVTSSSRKEVIPTLDRTGAMLWYNVPYEGFETSDRVIYSHACANQHLLPLLDWCFRTRGTRAFLTGSNYIWGWETCRVARATIEKRGGRVLGERFLPLGDVNVGGLIAAVEASQPDFVLNSLVGASSYQFLDAYADLGKRDARFRPDTCPVVSCNLTECELDLLGDAAEGLVSAGPSFSMGMSSMELASHRSVLTLAQMLTEAGDMPFDAFLNAKGVNFGIDPETNHATLDVKVAQVKNGVFEVLAEWPKILPDPYLTRPARHPSLAHPELRVVS